MKTADNPKEIRIYTSARRWFSFINWGELWNYRELTYFLSLRDIKIRYKQAALGVTWAILQPIITMLIFSVIFGNLAKLPSDGIPYPVFSFAALLPWQLFSGSLSRASTSLVSNNNLITKVYFPRIIIPLSSIGAGLLDFFISFIVFLGLMLYYGLTIKWQILFLPLFVIFSIIAAFAVGLWFSALNVQYRDVQYALPFLIQAWMYASPIAYSQELIPQGFWRVLYGLNPMAGVIQGFRWTLLGASPPDNLMIASITVVMILLLSGLLYFKHFEDSFADII